MLLNAPKLNLDSETKATVNPNLAALNLLKSRMTVHLQKSKLVN